MLRFLEFGENRKFIINSFSSDAASEPISMPFGFPFGSVIHTLAYVSKLALFIIKEIFNEVFAIPYMFRLGLMESFHLVDHFYSGTLYLSLVVYSVVCVIFMWLPLIGLIMIFVEKVLCLMKCFSCKPLVLMETDC